LMILEVFSSLNDSMILNLYHKCSLKVSSTKGAYSLSPLLRFTKTMSCMLGNVLCAASHCIPVKDRYSRKKRGGRKLYKDTRREGEKNTETKGRSVRVYVFAGQVATVLFVKLCILNTQEKGQTDAET